jgi:hypothetical protein
MMVLPGGMERTPEEFSTLLAAGGFHLDRIVYTHTGMNVIEASPI